MVRGRGSVCVTVCMFSVRQREGSLAETTERGGLERRFEDAKESLEYP